MSGIAAPGAFFPFGSGLGTFPEVYRRFQPDDIAQFVNPCTRATSSMCSKAVWLPLQ